MKFSFLILFITLIHSIIQSFNHTTMTQTNTKAFINGKIYTVNENQPYAEALVIEGNIIKYVGSESGAQEYITSETEVIDLDGKLMLPGFNDSHLHFLSGGHYLLGINLRPALSKEEFVNIIIRI